MGSTKDAKVFRQPTLTQFGFGRWDFSDRYSVMDYAHGGRRMEEDIPGKGIALRRTSVDNFEDAAEAGVLVHYVPKATQEDRMYFKVSRIYSRKVPLPDDGMEIGFRYKVPKGATHFVIPLEIIYRNVISPDSSVLKMILKDQIGPSAIGIDMTTEGFLVMLEKNNGFLPKPIITFTTKFEAKDEFLSRNPNFNQAYALSGLTPYEFQLAETTALFLNNLINEHTSEIAHASGQRLVHEDGKCELIRAGPGQIMVGDVFGTLDEDRFTIYRKDRPNVKLSKQVLRDWHKQSPWKKAYDAWQAEVAELRQKGTKKKLPEPPKPQPLPSELVSYVSQMYQEFSLVWVGKEDARTLDRIVEEHDRLVREDLIRVPEDLAAKVA
jgi:phosphoribosylaminoimidazole-succinocarboxamide synthase